MENKIIIGLVILLIGMFGWNQYLWNQRLKKEVITAVEHDREIRRQEIKLIKYEIDTIYISKPSLDSALLILGWQ